MQVAFYKNNQNLCIYKSKNTHATALYMNPNKSIDLEQI